MAFTLSEISSWTVSVSSPRVFWRQEHVIDCPRENMESAKEPGSQATPSQEWSKDDEEPFPIVLVCGSDTFLTVNSEFKSGRVWG